MMGARPWKIADRLFDVSRQGMIMGVLNVTPDSFSDGARFFDEEAAVRHGLEMARDGAQIIDVGGESTRPGSDPVPLAEELRRVIPVIEQLQGQAEAFISIDTSKAEVARRALDAGAVMVNDVTGGRGDAAMLPLVAERGAALILMHMQGNPKTMQLAPSYENVVEDVANFFRQQSTCALECGIDPMAVAFDPGIGFGKTLEHNLELLRNLGRLRLADRPLVVGVSRKAFLGKLAQGAEMDDRDLATVILTAVLRGRGADVLRVHDVAGNVRALRVAEAVLAS
jgi:dihydropteroate synthase